MKNTRDTMGKTLITVLLVASSISLSECRSQNAFLSGNLKESKLGCVCNLGNKFTVPEMFTEPHEYERLVVYLYRDKKNNERLVYIPDAIKQKYLPDMSHDEDDILKSVGDDEKIIDIFYNYPNQIITHHDRVETDKVNPSVQDRSKTRPKIVNKEDLPTFPPYNDLSQITIPPSKGGHYQNIAPVQIPSNARRIESKIYYVHPKNLTKNSVNKEKYNSDTLKKDDNRNVFVTEIPTASTIIPIIHEAKEKHNNYVTIPRDYVPINAIKMDSVTDNHKKHFPNHTISAPERREKEVEIKRPYNTETIPKTKHSDKSFIIPTKKNERLDEIKSYDIHFPSYNMIKPSSKYDSVRDQHKNKSQHLPHPITSSKINVPLKNLPSVKIHDPYETLIDIIINYPQLVIAPSGKDSEVTPSNIEPKGEVTKMTIDTKDSVPMPHQIFRTPIKSKIFDIDPTNIYNENPERDQVTEQTPIAVTKIHLCKLPNGRFEDCQRIKNADFKPVNILEDISDNRHSIDKVESKPIENVKLCNYCKHNTVNHIGYQTFDQWFREEMYEFRHDKYNIDVYWVGTYILKLLREHGLYISDNGLLRDSTGKVLRWQNFKLRAMFVGDSVSLDEIWQPSDTKKYPEYLAFLILMSISPPKNLGIIPLGRTILPHSASLQSLSKEPKPEIVNYVKIRENRYIKRNPNKYDESVEKFLETLPYRSQDNVENEVAQNKNNDKQKHNHDYINSEDLFGNEDMLRIIGGSAATGSGTPVSSKGRSTKLDS